MARLERAYEQLVKRLGDLTGSIDARFAQVDTRFAQMDTRFVQVENKLDGLQSRMTSLILTTMLAVLFKH